MDLGQFEALHFCLNVSFKPYIFENVHFTKNVRPYIFDIFLYTLHTSMCICHTTVTVGPIILLFDYLIINQSIFSRVSIIVSTIHENNTVLNLISPFHRYFLH